MSSIPQPTALPGARSAVSIRRFVNDEIAHLATLLDPDDRKRYDFICECGDLGCQRTAPLTVAQYQASPPGAVVGHPVLVA